MRSDSGTKREVVERTVNIMSCLLDTDYTCGQIAVECECNPSDVSMVIAAVKLFHMKFRERKRGPKGPHDLRSRAIKARNTLWSNV